MPLTVSPARTVWVDGVACVRSAAGTWAATWEAGMKAAAGTVTPGIAALGCSAARGGSSAACAGMAKAAEDSTTAGIAAVAAADSSTRRGWLRSLRVIGR